MVGDYYGEYYDKSYKGYYDLNVEDDDVHPATPAKPAKPVPASAPGRG